MSAIEKERTERTVNGCLQYLTPDAQFEREEFDSHFQDGNTCTCFISPPCGWCVHPGNPHNQEEDDTAWEDASSGIMQDDRPAIHAMDIQQSQYCKTDLCNRFIDIERQALGLDSCWTCSQAEIVKAAEIEKKYQQGFDVVKANNAVYAKLTSNLIDR